MSQERDRDVRGARPDVDHVKRRSVAGERIDRPDRQGGAPEAAVHAGQVMEVAAEDRRIVQRPVEQLVHIAEPAHRARVGVGAGGDAAPRRPVGVCYTAAMTRVVVAGEALIDRVTRPGRRCRRDPRWRAVQHRSDRCPPGHRHVVRGASVHGSSRSAAARRARRRRRRPCPCRHDRRPDDDRPSPTLDERGSATYRFDLDGTSAAGLTLADVLATGLRPAAIAVLHVGTLGLVLEPSGTAIERLVEDVGASCLVMLDPNARPSATRDPGAHRARIARLAARADVIKVSVDDLRYLAADGAAETGLSGLLDAGGRPLVLVTDGAAAVEVVSATDRRRLPVPRVTVVDSVGAGDAFGGGFLAAWVDGGRGRAGLDDLDAVEAATRRAIAVAALTCTRPGAQPPTRHEVDQFLVAGPDR